MADVSSRDASLKSPSEWLVVDGRGAFAMGSVHGPRVRKYHGFFLGISGRSEASFISDMSFELDGKDLWPHFYREQGEIPQGVVFPPITARYEPAFGFPSWVWDLSGGHLSFSVEACDPGGISLSWRWKAHQSAFSAMPKKLDVRLLAGMRPLHSLGGQQWNWEARGDRLQISSPVPDEERTERWIEARLEGRWSKRDAPLWYENFYYSEECARGYPAQESLFSAGILSVHLDEAHPVASLVFAERGEDLGSGNIRRLPHKRKTTDPVFDFMLTDPPGVVAGFPWFGEWGRDTFISLPGIVGRSLRGRNLGVENEQKVCGWAIELLSGWGKWISLSGMLPNVIEKGGSHQWQSADATLWWTHSLASLWAMSIADPRMAAGPLATLKTRFLPLLESAIRAIRTGQHLFLRTQGENERLEVLEAHTTWMDARVDELAVTPRAGALPEINALWFQARVLRALWSGGIHSFAGVENWARDALSCREPDRPNTVFLYSLPLAPAYILSLLEGDTGDIEGAKSALSEIRKKFWTPVGLRSLAQTHPNYRAVYAGTQRERDLSYHQGPVWGWLGGHYEMAARRFGPEVPMREPGASEPRPLLLSTIEGHLAEIYDPEPPYAPRGAPAQAWSLACHEEAKVMAEMEVDLEIERIFGGSL
jgi:hypothetical protein